LYIQEQSPVLDGFSSRGLISSVDVGVCEVWDFEPSNGNANDDEHVSAVHTTVDSGSSNELHGSFGHGWNGEYIT